MYTESGNQVLNILSDTTGLPTEDDLRHSASSVLRIQHVYDLATSQVSIVRTNFTKDVDFSLQKEI